MNNLMDFLEMYKVGEFIYPSVIKRNLKQVDQHTIDALIKDGYLGIVNYASCPQCSHYTHFYSNEELMAMKDCICCDNCDFELSRKDFRQAYKVIKKTDGYQNYK